MKKQRFMPVDATASVIREAVRQTDIKLEPLKRVLAAKRIAQLRQVGNGNTTRTEAADRALAKLPDSIRVGPYDVEIEKIDVLRAMAEGNYGRFSSVTVVIGIQWGASSVHRLVETFLHEVFHAIWWAYNVEDEGANQEKLAILSGTAWMAVHRDNPWLALWIAETLSQ